MGGLNSGEEDEFKGLYVSEEEVNQLLNDPSLFLSGNYSADIAPKLIEDPKESRLLHLQNTFGLSRFELDVLLVALAPEIELRYEKLFAYLQDDVTRRRPTINLVLKLLVPGLAGQLAARRCFDPDAPLLHYRLLELSEENQNRATSLLSRTIKLDDGLVSFLLGDDSLDSRLRPYADFAEKDEAAPRLSEEASEYARRLVELAHEPGGYVCVLSGPDEYNKRRLAAEVCQEIGLPLLIFEIGQLGNIQKTESILRLLEREIILRELPVYLASYEILLKEDGSGRDTARLLEKLLVEHKGLCFIPITQNHPPLLARRERRELKINLAMPGYGERQQLWETQLGKAAVGLDLESLSNRFRLSSGQIVAAAATARNLAAWRGETAPTLEDLETACRRHSNQKLSGLARKIEPHYRWDDLVLPYDQTNMLREVCEQVRHRSMVYEKWGFEKKLSLGKGLNVVFAGQSGTGKTMSAEIIAGELKLDLYKIDLSNVVSKYIGETEKNLERIFTEAGESNAILFFDEADSIFGKRSEVKDAHDRYANIETGYLLQKMEEYDGIVVLATNLRKNLDEAFVRRMHFVLEFPFPEEEDRFQIWSRVFPKDVPLSQNVDLRFMAKQFKVAGGNIKNIALAAAFLAASAGPDQMVEMEHMIRATRREFQKMGKLCTESDFGPYFKLIQQ
jgi:ATP-dependent 26S proteasome regulatory subunit